MCLLRGTFCVLPTQFICFLWISEQTAIISLYSTDWLVFVTETKCVYCEVRTKFNILIFNWQCHGSGGQSSASHHEGQVSIPSQSTWDFGGTVVLKSFFLSIENMRPDRLWGPPSALFDRQRRFFPWGYSGWCVKLTTYLHLVSTLAMCGAIPCFALCLQLYHSWVVKYCSDALQDSLRTQVTANASPTIQTSCRIHCERQSCYSDKLQDSLRTPILLFR